MRKKDNGKLVKITLAWLVIGLMFSASLNSAIARQSQALYSLDGKLSVTVLTDRSQIAPGESLVLIVQVANVGKVTVTSINVTLALPEGFVSNQTGSIHLNDLIPNATDYKAFSVMAQSNATPNNYAMMAIVKSTNAPTIVTAALITVRPRAFILDQLIPSPILQTLLFITIFGGLATAAIKWYFDKKAKDKETYIKSLDELKDSVFMHYVPMAGYAKEFAERLDSARSLKESEIKYSFYLLAVFFSRRLRFHHEKGGVLKLQTHEAERLSEEIYKKGRENLPFTSEDISIIQRHVPYNAKLADFVVRLNQEIELVSLYDVFQKWIRGPITQTQINEVIKNFRYYGEYLMYQTTLMFSAWYKREGWDRIKFWKPKATLSRECEAYIKSLQLK